MFFKEGQKEEMACQGAQIVSSLVQNDHVEIESIASVVKDRRLWIKYKEILGQYVCSRCDFQKEDCDFQSPSPSEDLEPCGGFIVLASLKEDNLIDEYTLGSL